MKQRAERTPPEFFSLQVHDARRFYLDLAPAPDGPLAVVCGGSEKCAPEYVIRRDTFPYYSIEFVARGTGSLRLGDRAYTLRTGSVFSYGPGVAQNITTDDRDPLVKYFVDFSGHRARELLDQCELPPGRVGRVFAPVDIQGIFDRLIQDGLRGSGFTGRLCVLLLEYLIVRMADSLMPAQVAQTPAHATYQRCRQHVETHCERLKTLGQIARECHVDPAYLCRLFRRYDHQTPYQFLLRLKMNRAAERLQDPQALVKQVSAELGFDDPFHFSRAFKNVFGLSPDAFRRLR